LPDRDPVANLVGVPDHSTNDPAAAPGDEPVSVAHQSRLPTESDELRAHAEALRLLQEGGYNPMVGGAYGLRVHTGLWRDTKDLDLFLRKDQVDAALAVLERAGYRVELTDPLWIAKAFCGEYLVDLIFSSGNGIAVVDEEWARRAVAAPVLGRQALVVAPEEIIWSKAFVQERERFDGADIHHLIRCKGEQIDWRYLLDRFAPHWHVLFSHLVMFRFAFPGERRAIPSWVMNDLASRVPAEELEMPVGEVARLCRGSLLSRQQYLHELNELGFADAREREVPDWRGDIRWPVRCRDARPVGAGRRIGDEGKRNEEGEDDANRSRG
jgi:hypothetical protein